MHFTKLLWEWGCTWLLSETLSVFASMQEREQFLRMHVKDAVQTPTKIWSDRQRERPSLQQNACSTLFHSHVQKPGHWPESHRFQDSNGILWFELQRELESIYYQRFDFVDVAPAWLMNGPEWDKPRRSGPTCITCQVQMYHPLAWGFPDSSKISTPNPGEPQGSLEGRNGERQEGCWQVSL